MTRVSSYRATTLPSGLRVATEVLPGTKSVTVAVSVDVGARFERENEGGLSHLLEHMAFKGTKRRSARQIAEEMDMVGGDLNAYTSLESTVYHARVLTRDVPLAVDVLADLLQHSAFDEKELEREREVILQELAMHNDSPDDLIFDHFSETAYPGQPLGRSILGTAKRVAKYQRADLKRYMRAHYHAPGMVVSAAGSVDHEDFVRRVRDAFGELPATAHTPARKARYRGGDRRTKRKLEQLHVMLGFEAVPFTHPEYYAWQLLATVLGGGMSSRLFQEVREKRGLAYTVQAFVSGYADSGVLGVYAATTEAKGAEMTEVLLGEIARLADGVRPIELRRAKNQITAGLYMSRESSAAIAEWIGRHLLTFGKYRPASEIADLVAKVTAKDVTRVAKKMLAQGGLTFTTLGPQKRLPSHAALEARLK